MQGKSNGFCGIGMHWFPMNTCTHKGTASYERMRAQTCDNKGGERERFYYNYNVFINYNMSHMTRDSTNGISKFGVCLQHMTCSHIWYTQKYKIIRCLHTSSSAWQMVSNLLSLMNNQPTKGIISFISLISSLIDQSIQLSF